MPETIPIKNYGFALVEIILYMAILSTLVFGIALFVNLVTTMEIKNQTMTEVDGQAMQVIEIITQTIRTAHGVISPSLGQEEDTLILSNAHNAEIEFTLEDGILMLDRGAGPVEITNDRVSVSDLSFKNLSRSGTPDIIEVTFTLTYNNNSSEQTYNYSHTYVAAAHLFK